MYGISLKMKPNATISKLMNAKDIIDKVAKTTLEKASLLVISKAKQEAPRKTSTLARSITYNVEKSGGDWQSRVGSNVEYAPHQEYGTGIYGKGSRIVPKRAKMLAWKGKTGKMIFARSVKGTKGKKFMQKGIDYLQDKMSEVQSIASQVMKQETGQ